MRRLRAHLTICLCLGWCAPAPAGLYNTAEPPVALHTELYRFLDQLGDLRGYSPPDGFTIRQETDQRKDYLQKVQRLRSQGRLSVQDQANLGAYLIRVKRTQPGIPDLEEGVQVLENARREEPRNFFVLANLGTVYQLTGRLDAAESCLQESAQRAPPQYRAFEQAHYQLVRTRLREHLRPGLAPLDALFPVRFVGDNGPWEPGKLAEAERKKLPADALKIVQQLLVWLPEDGRLHWLLGELANAQGDVKSAHRALDLAVNTFRLSTPELKEHRVQLQEAKAQLPSADEPPAGLFAEETNSAESKTAPPGPPITLDWRAWLVIGGGSVLVLGFLIMQFRESWRRRATRSPAPPHR